MGKISYFKLASTDLYENAEYIARDKPEAAYRWIETIEEVCATLGENPEMGQARKFQEPWSVSEFQQRKLRDLFSRNRRRCRDHPHR
jgi:plasmid stabilization system protein ParE